ncbi:MAG TPA: cation-translocating P-type ATPase, partial [Marmoricola sp.]
MTTDTTTVDLEIHGMTCASCVARVEGRLNSLDGVRATVNLATESAHVVHDGRIEDDDLVAAVAAAGYEARTAGSGHHHDDRVDHLSTRLVTATPLAVIVVVLAMAPGVPRLPWLQLALAVPIVAWAGWPFHRAAWNAARHGASTMDTLVSIGTTAAFAWSAVALASNTSGHLYFEVAAVVTTFLLLGRWLEARTKRSAGAALRALLEAGAKRAVLADFLGEREVDVTDLRPGNHVVVRPGAQVPTDAIVVDGRSHLDESMVTGECRPVSRSVGDPLIGGTLNLDARIVAEVTSIGADTVLARLAAAVSRAQEGKAAVQRLADRVSAVFVPVVLAIASITFVGWRLSGGSWTDAFVAAVAVLVVACPCALGLATPTALLVGTGRAAQLGIVVRDAAVLEQVRSIDTVVLDKTGTLTTGAMTVRSTAGDDAAIRLAAAVEAGSEHP